MSVINNGLLLASAADAAAGYQISRSLRFNNTADTAYLNRTPGSASNRRTWTWAGWLKRSALSNINVGAFFIANVGAGSNYWLAFNSSNQLEYYEDISNSAQVTLATTAVYRDVSAWYHVVLAVDTTQGTAANRVKLYVNGAQVTAFSTSSYPAQNYQSHVNNTTAHGIGGFPVIAYYFSGYLADIHFCDGTAYDASAFGEFDSNGIWQPKAFSGTYGTNGFRLTFSDNSGTTATTLGKDAAGSNNFTPNNFSVATGAGNDSLVDVPTTSGTDNGNGGEIRGNYATFNALNVNTSLGTSAFSNGNLDVSGTTANGMSTIAPSSGKWYAEFVYTAIGSSTAFVGVSNLLSTSAFYGATQTWQLNYTQLGKLENAGSQSNVSTYTTNDVIGVAFDCSNGQATFYKNGSSVGSITNSAFANVPVVIGLGYGGATGTNTASANFGQRPFAYTAPSGFKALCTANLPAPLVTKPSTVFDIVLRTASGTSGATVSSLNFSPDFIWSKLRSAAASHYLVDTVRGVANNLLSNSTNAEVSYPTFFTSTTSNGYTIGNFDYTAGSSVVEWAWDAGSTTVSNSDGSITSSVRANATAGFSIVSYTGTGSNATVGHGLGVAPSMVIIKERSQGTGGWIVYHKSIGSGGALYLNTTQAVVTASTWFNSTSPTSTVFSLGANGELNDNGQTNIAYCFAPVNSYSAFGSYTGNGSSDGPLVFCNFRPRWVMVKRTDSSGTGWQIHDAARNASNVVNLRLQPNNSDAESSYTTHDFLSNGFKLRDSDASWNASGGTYVYAAFAESPFQYARAR